MLEKFKRNKEELPLVSPNVNMYQKDKDTVLAVEMPGADKESLDVHLGGNHLVIKGKKKKEEIRKEYELLHQERPLVEFERRFEINTEIDKESINAEYSDGVLKVSLARSEAVEPRRITIKA